MEIDFEAFNDAEAACSEDLDADECFLQSFKSAGNYRSVDVTVITGTRFLHTYMRQPKLECQSASSFFPHAHLRKTFYIHDATDFLKVIPCQSA